MKLLLQMPGESGAHWQSSLQHALPEAEIRRWPDGAGDVDFALVWKPPPELFERVRVRRAIMNLGAGVDALLRVATLPRDVVILRLEDAGMAEQMAEFATFAVLSAYREIDAYRAAQHEARWSPRPRQDKRSFGVGIMGFGVLGQAVARVLSPLGFPLAAWSRRRHQAAGVASFAGAGELAAFLARARVLICLLPSTPQTHGILNREALRALPRDAHVVNLARGELVVDADLLALLDEGHLASATLDVFRDEPLPAAHPFWHHARVTLTPHVSAVTCVGESVAQVANKIRRLAGGAEVSGVVDLARGY